MRNNRPHSESGFTLAELVVATTLISIVMLGIYTTFHSTILHWRNGSENEGTFADARRVFTLMEYDFSGIPNDRDGVDAREFFWGDESSLHYITVAQPFDLDERPVQRLMQVSYHVSDGQLIREERALESPLLASAGPNAGIQRERLEFGRAFQSPIAEQVLDMRLRYLWTPIINSDTDAAPTWVDLIELDRTDYRLPDGVTVDLVLYDPAKDPESPGTRFTRTFIFNGESSRPPASGQNRTELFGGDDA